MTMRRAVLVAALLFASSTAFHPTRLRAQFNEGEACQAGATQRTYTHYESGAWEWVVYGTGGHELSRQDGNYGHTARPHEIKHIEDVCQGGRWKRNVIQYY